MHMRLTVPRQWHQPECESCSCLSADARARQCNPSGVVLRIAVLPGFSRLRLRAGTGFMTALSRLCGRATRNFGRTYGSGLGIPYNSMERLGSQVRIPERRQAACSRANASFPGAESACPIVVCEVSVRSAGCRLRRPHLAAPLAARFAGGVRLQRHQQPGRVGGRDRHGQAVGRPGRGGPSRRRQRRRGGGGRGGGGAAAGAAPGRTGVGRRR